MEAPEEKVILNEKTPESGELGLADLEILDNHGGVEFNLDVKNWPEGEREMSRAFLGVIKCAIDNAGQEMFQGSKESNQEDFKQYMSAENIGSLLKYFLNPKILIDHQIKLKIKDRFNQESEVDLSK